jgi:hypothetical protein
MMLLLVVEHGAPHGRRTDPRREGRSEKEEGRIASSLLPSSFFLPASFRVKESMDARAHAARRPQD